MMKIKTVGILALALPLLIAATPQKKPTSEQLKQEFTKLQQEFYKAQEEYYAPYQKAAKDGKPPPKLDKSKDPALLFLARFKSFAKRAEGDLKAGPLAEGMVIQVAGDRDKKATEESIGKLLGMYITSPDLAQQLYPICMGYDMMLGWNTEESNKATTKALMTIETKSPHKEVRVAALYQRGVLLSSPYETEKPDIAAAKRVFNRVIEQYGDTQYAERAKGALFEMDNLSIGKVAPDFELEDENGVKWKLSDYRGKVVVLDFWGFW
ncbi:MAG: redoxin domain-containing protein [Fimbriimonadaceae bacterium]|nr:redoxin domain-containing protein [Fimbriimonadaceae bacterium]